MEASGRLSDHDHPLIRAKAEELTGGRHAGRDSLARIFAFVRDDIRFGFPPKWDAVRASETIGYGLGTCNTKATLLVALCRASGIPARIHAGLISIEIMRGVFPSVAFPFLPRAGSHSWSEVQLDDEWNPIDSYINDKPFYDAALQRLRQSGRATGFSISQAKGPSSCELNFGEEGFVQMGAVVEDHGTWNDFSEYMSSTRYFRMNRMQLASYPWLARMSNRRIARIRSGPGATPR
jgi:hypothetical protein